MNAAVHAAELQVAICKVIRQNSGSADSVGPITALTFKATIDDPTRFARSRSVGAYFGITGRRRASGEVDWSGRISKCGDAMLRRSIRSSRGSADPRPKIVRAESLGGPDSPSAMGLAMPRLRSHANSRSFCIACGSKEPNSTGRRRLLPSRAEYRDPARRREKASLPGRWRW